jgi:endonuclease/exonuclease/phosphatase family metal-dependent hydrolase
LKKADKNTTKKRHPLLKGVLILLTLASAVMQSVPLIYVDNFPYGKEFFSITGLFFPWFMFINLFLLFFWLTTGKKWFLVSLAALVITAGIPGGYYQINPFGNEVHGDSLKVLTYNVKYLGMDYSKSEEKSKDQILDFLSKENADVICLQEFDCLPGTFLESIDELKNITKTSHYVFTRYYPGLKNSERILLLTKDKVVNKGSLSDDHSRRYAVYADILRSGDTIRVINCHLQSIYLREEDNLGLEDFRAENAGIGIIQEKSKRIYAKLATAFQKRAAQSDSLVAFIESSPHRIILCGDFNDTPSSYTYFSVKKHLTDVFRKTGHGSGITFGDNFPAFRIDYIFHDPDFSPSEFTIHKKEKFSDHYPVTSRIYLKSSM